MLSPVPLKLLGCQSNVIHSSSSLDDCYLTYYNAEMSTSDAAFPEDEQDWTQITQPRVRKRVQNRLSQRKHRKTLQTLFAMPRFGPLPPASEMA